MGANQLLSAVWYAFANKMFPEIFKIEHEKQKVNITNVNDGQPMKTNGLVCFKKLSWNINSKNNIPNEADKKNITPTAKVRDMTDSPLQYFLIRIILQAKKKPAIMGKNCKDVKVSDQGSKISKAPKLPNIRAKNLQIPILSLRNIIAKKDTKIGNV